jgi:SNF2 family DNA or RNA helicase
MFVDGASKTLGLRVRDPFAVRAVLPKQSRLVTHPRYNIVVKHTLDNVRVLKNLGIKAPSPIGAQYNWPGKYTPFDHQRIMSDFLTVNQKGFNLSEMGCGKSASALWAADYLMNIGVVKKCLIISPLSTLDVVWKQDIFDVLMHRQAGVVHGSMDRRKEIFAQDLDFYILNHDGIGLPDIAKIVRARKDINLIIVDEVSMFRNSRTDKYKLLDWVLEKKERLWCLTGTPFPNAPTDSWALTRLVDKTRVPKFFGAFQRKTMIKVSGHKWVPKLNAKETVYEAMQPAVRFLKKDCLTLPPVVMLNRQSRLTAEQTKAFKEMKADMIASARGTAITAITAADKIIKLRQILCGCVKVPGTDNYIPLDHSHRLQDLKDAIDQASAKVLVVVPFKGIINELAKELRKGNYTVGVINGDVSPKRRAELISAFRFETDPQVLLCHPKVMAHGLNMTVADTTIFYAPIYSNDEFEQVIERFNRAGQTRKMSIIRIAAHPIEWEIYRMVDTKRLTQRTILDLYSTITDATGV